MDTQQFKVTKSNVESYKLRHPSGGCWADITIDATGESGRIQIASDFGSWQNFWSHCGMPFKSFLLKVDMDYVARKFSAKSFFDADQNIKSARFQILTSRKEGVIDAEYARCCFDDLKNLEGECTDSATHFHALVNSTENLHHFYYDGGFSAITTYDPGFKHFWKKIWPAFLDELRKESAVLTE